MWARCIFTQAAPNEYTRNSETNFFQKSGIHQQQQQAVEGSMEGSALSSSSSVRSFVEVRFSFFRLVVCLIDYLILAEQHKNVPPPIISDPPSSPPLDLDAA